LLSLAVALVGICMEAAEAQEDFVQQLLQLAEEEF
jgi:hypothetical protein